MGIWCLYLELDAEILCDLILEQLELSWHLHPFTSGCRKILRKFWECRATYIYRETNGAADFLAKMAGGPNSIWIASVNFGITPQREEGLVRGCYLCCLPKASEL